MSAPAGTAENPDLFTPLKLRGVTIRNRIGIPPMCMYRAENGKVTDFHLIHYGSRAIGGAGLIIVEATAVVPEGRISAHDVGIWSDEHIAGLRHLTDCIRREGATPAIQLAHAGRKGSTAQPWVGRGMYLPSESGGWQVVGPSPVSFAPGGPVPHELSVSEIQHVVKQFAEGARRAHEAGFDAIEIHSAHGYLLNEFLSPLSNKRTDSYGGSFENRTRLLREVVTAIRAPSVWPADKPLLVRISVSDWVDGGWEVSDSVKLASMLKEIGVDMMDCSSGGNSAQAKYNPFACYQVPYAEQIRKETGMLTAAVGMIVDPKAANEIITQHKADLVLIGREILRDPHWPLHAAKALQRPEAECWVNSYAWCVGPRKG